MTNLDLMLKWYAPETVTLYCDECGREMQSVDGRNRKVLCEDCKAERIRRHMNARNRDRGITRYTFDDPTVDLVFAVIKQAIHDREREWRAPRFSDMETDMRLEDCDPADFLRDGASLWLEALGLTLRPSMKARLATMEEK